MSESPSEQIVQQAESEPCTCLTQLQSALLAENTYIETAMWMNLETQARRYTVKIPTRKFDSRNRKRAVPVSPTFCPFCGQRYTPEAPAAAIARATEASGE